MGLTPPEIAVRMAGWPIARLATVGADGVPHQVPIVFARHAGRLWSPIDGKPKSGGELRRVRNLRADPRCSLLLDHWDDDWDELWWVRLEATAEIVVDPAALEPVAKALRAKYPQYETTPVFRAPPMAVAFTPVKTTSWSASPSSGS